MPDEKVASSQQLAFFASTAFRSAGVPQKPADLCADALATTDLMGVHTHGTKLLAGYVRKLQAGGYQPAAVPQIEREGPGWAVINGNSCLGQVGCFHALDVGLSKAAKVGVAYIGLRNTGHIGAAGIYAAHAARNGCLCMVTGNDIPSVAAPGSRKAVLGSNPIALSVPVPDSNPILLDIATAAVAGGKVYAAIQRGEEIPDTWLIGPDGHPTTDGKLYPQQTALAPMAGHKGYGFGLWCEVLSAVVPGGRITWEVGSWIFDDSSLPSAHNAGFVLISSDVVADPSTYRERIHKLVAEIRAAETARGTESIMLPGEREWAHVRHAEQHGITLPADVVEKLQEAARLTDQNPDWLCG